MAFDWSSVDPQSMASSSSLGDRVWRQLRLDDCGGYLEGWLRDLWAWGFDSLTLDDEAEAWLAKMRSGHLVLINGDVFERAVCGLEEEPGHRHTRYCAGPQVIKREAKKEGRCATRGCSRAAYRRSLCAECYDAALEDARDAERDERRTS